MNFVQRKRKGKEKKSKQKDFVVFFLFFFLSCIVTIAQTGMLLLEQRNLRSKI